LLEVVSVQAAERRLKKPIEVPRPRPPKRRPVAQAQTRRETEKAAGAVSVSDAMSAFHAAGRVRNPAAVAAQQPIDVPAGSAR
jgi:hypothetical protein